MIEPRRRCAAQPPYGILRSDVYFAYVPSIGILDAARALPLTVTSTTLVPSTSGIRAYASGAPSGFYYQSIPDYLKLQELTLFFKGRIVGTGVTADNPAILALWNNSTNAAPYLSAGMHRNSTTLRFFWNSAGTFNNIDVASVLNNGTEITIAMAIKPGVVKGYFNGAEVANSTSLTSIQYTSTSQLTILRHLAGTNSNDMDSMCDVAFILPYAASAAEIRSLTDNPWQIFKTRGRLRYADVIGGAITLSGAAITSAEGAVSSANTITVTGINSTGSQGATTPSILSPLIGGLITETGGSLTPTADVTPAGILYTAYYGSTTPANTTAISGSSATASNGSVSAESIIALVGAAATSYYGIVTAQADGSITLSGIAMTSAAGATTADLSVSTAGQQASHAQGSVIPVSVISLSGDVQTVSVGAVSPTLSAALSGLSAALARGTVTPVADGVITLVGMDILAQEGALSTVVDKSLSGNSVTLTKGDVGYEFLYSLIGSSLTGSVGTFAVNRDGAITGTTATTAYENLTAQLSQGLTGWQIDSAQDSLSVDRTKAISGSQITSAPGTVAFTLRDITLTLTGIAITAQYGHLAIDGAVLIDAGNQTVLICEKGTSVFLVEKVSVMIM